MKQPRDEDPLTGSPASGSWPGILSVCGGSLCTWHAWAVRTPGQGRAVWPFALLRTTWWRFSSIGTWEGTVWRGGRGGRSGWICPARTVVAAVWDRGCTVGSVWSGGDVGVGRGLRPWPRHKDP